MVKMNSILVQKESKGGNRANAKIFLGISNLKYKSYYGELLSTQPLEPSLSKKETFVAAVGRQWEALMLQSQWVRSDINGAKSSTSA